MYRKKTNKPDILSRYVYKILHVMRLTTVILVISMLQVSAASLAQKFNYVKKGVPLSQIFKEIKKQTGYNMLWNEKELDVSILVNADFKGSTIEEVLDKCLANLPVSYTISNKMILIKQKVSSSLKDKIIDFFSSIDVRGRVVDENGQPLVGALVKVKGTKQATSTNSNGEFVLNGVDESAVLVVSFIGYQIQEIAASKNMGIVKLMQSTDKLEEVEINAGYYTVTDRERTGTISKISSKKIEQQSVNNPLQALQGQITGVDITQNTGVPGGGFTVRVRGQNSIAQGSDPYYVIDGVPFTSISLASSKSIGITNNPSPLSSLNPSDIESIEVLKDADATAIYGSRGANGVVLISTKKGKLGRAYANININQSILRVSKILNLMNTEQYLEMRNEAFSNDKLSPGTNQFDVNGQWGNSNDSDWQKQLIGKNASATNIQTSISGGSEQLKYFVGTSYYKEGTVFPGENSFGRRSGNMNLSYSSANNKFTAIFTANYSQTSSNLFTQDMTSYIFLAPNFPSLLDEMGALNWANNTIYVNPLAQLNRSYDSNSSNLISNAVLSYNLGFGLKIKSSFGYTTLNRKDYTREPLSTTSPVFNNGSDQRAAYFANAGINTWITEPQISYDVKLGSGKLSLMLGTSFQESITDGQEVKGSNFTSDALLGNIAAAGILTIPQRQYLQYRYSAVFGRVNYTINDKYIFNATGRRDGSSRFGTENRFATFGALGVAWIFAEENFVKNFLSFLNFGKIRVSYGTAGNDQIADYAYLELWNTFVNSYQGTTTITPNQISNPNYAWESNKKAEAAIDLVFLKNKINVSLGFYNNKSSNQLINKQLAPSTGFISIQDNLSASVRNRGWEFELSTENVSKRNFNWITSINLTIPQNKLLSYPNLRSSNDALLYEVGFPLSILKTYNTKIDGQTGLYISEDYDKNGVINDVDRYIIKYRGKQYYGGIQNFIKYKQINFDFLFQFVKQTGKSFYSGFSNNAGRFLPGSPFTNQSLDVLDRWKNLEDKTSFQKYSTLPSATTSYNNARNFGSLAIEDASFIRLKNISISYNLSSRSKKIKMGDAKLYIQGQNLFTITKYKGLDPETQSLNVLPSLQVFTAGLQLTF